MMSKNHKASCGIMGTDGSSNERVGTRFAQTNVEVWQMMGKPYFKFRNNEERTKWFAWQEKTTEKITQMTHTVETVARKLMERQWGGDLPTDDALDAEYRQSKSYWDGAVHMVMHTLIDHGWTPPVNSKDLES